MVFVVQITSGASELRRERPIVVERADLARAPARVWRTISLVRPPAPHAESR